MSEPHRLEYRTPAPKRPSAWTKSHVIGLAIFATPFLLMLFFYLAIRFGFIVVWLD